MPRRSPLNMKVQTVELSEKQREKNAVDTLRRLGYEVLTTGKPVPVMCRNCRAHQFAATTGNTPGTPDVLVSHPDWPIKCYKGLETKKSGKAPRRPEQVRLADLGLSTFYVTEEQAVRTIIDIEQKMGLEPNPALLNWIQCNVQGAWHAENAALLANDTPNAAWRP